MLSVFRFQKARSSCNLDSVRRNHRAAVRVHCDCAAVCFYVPVFSFAKDFVDGSFAFFVAGFLVVCCSASFATARFFIFNIFCCRKNCIFAPGDDIVSFKPKIPFYAHNTKFRCVQFFKIFQKFVCHLLLKSFL